MAATAVSERWKVQCDYLSETHKTFRSGIRHLMKIPRMHRFMRYLRTVDEKRRLEVRLSKSIDLSSSPPGRRGTV